MSFDYENKRDTEYIRAEVPVGNELFNTEVFDEFYFQ